VAVLTVPCKVCNKLFRWFSGNVSQVCSECLGSSCPLCGKKMVVTGDGGREDGGHRCPDGCYSYNHSYGCHEEHYDQHDAGHNVLSLGWHYTETPEQSNLRKSLVDAFMAFARSR
jgi:hypothetical protein